MSDYDSKIIRKQIRVYGSVQGVGFRYRGADRQGICNGESGYLCKYRENGCQINTGG